MAEIEKLTCTKHGNKIDISNFYVASENSIFSGIGYIPICKNCLYEFMKGYYNQYNDMKLAMYYMCRKIDVAFDGNIFEGSLKSNGNNHRKVFQSYMVQYNSFGKKNGVQLSFDNGEHINTSPLKLEEKIKDEDIENNENAVNKVEITEEDIKNKDEVIRLIAYDPFEGYGEADQKFLYSDLLNYLVDEDVVEDQFLVSQIIQVVNNNNQIRKLDYLLSTYMIDIKTLSKNQGVVKSINSTKKDIVASTDKIAKENKITVKSRGNKGGSKATLTGILDRLRELNFEEAEINYYDQKKAYGMQRAANISMKAMTEQMDFDENDINDIIGMQRDMIKDMEEKILDIEEENRQLHIKLAQYDEGEVS